MSGDVRGFLIERIAARCGLIADEVDPDRPLEEFGLSSRDAVGIAGELAGLLGRDLAPTLVWEHPTIARLAAALGSPSPEPVAGPFTAADHDDAIAVVGLGCRVPGAHGPEEFWRLLMEGRDAVTTVPEGRWEPFAGLEATRHGGFLDDIAGFDAEFFGISPGEAETMDPQQRLLLETAWEALEHGGLAPRSLRGSRTGVFVGISGNEYAYLTTADPAGIDAWTATGAALSIAANRLSYLLDLRGPSLALDTACSSSLVAVHLAVRSLRSGECDLAVAGGVNLLLSPVVTRAFDQGGGTSPDGRCKAFDASADGMVRAEGCGVVVLKRLADADGDRVLAVIRATGVNQDGRSNGLVAPNPEAQQALLASVYGGLDRGPDYIECHGTGTFLGDPIEGRAIAASVDGRVLIGSVKSNLGHLEAAAGVTGVIKTALSLWHGVLPASIHFATPNPHLPWERLEVVTEPTPWPRDDARAGVSSFGFGGTNAHVVLDACPPARADAGGEARPAAPLLDAGAPTARRLFVLSDASAERVREHAALLAAWRPAADPADIAHTLARRAHRGRIAAAAFDLADLPAATPAPVRPATRPPVWVFSGYGSQWPGMGAHLHRTEPAFRACLEELAPLLRAEAGIDLWSEPEGVATAQPLIFAVQLALARLWQAYGMHPGAVIGHSMGEVAAAVVAGGLGVHDGVRVICRRARRLASLGGGGAMAVVDVAAAQVPGSLHVAVYASQTRTVVTGAPDEIARFAEQLAAREVFCRVLTTEGAGHSPQVQPLLPLLRSDLAALTPAKATIPFYSTVFDDPREAPTFEAAYWAAGIRRPVRLTQALRAAADDGFTLFTEVSPHPMLGLDFCSTRRDSDESFYAQLALAAASSPPRTRGRIVDVPHAPWRHTRHWADRVRRPTGHPVLGVHVETPSGHAWSVELSEGTHLSLAQVAELACAAASELGTTAGRVRLHAPLALPAQVTVTVGEDLVEVSRKNAAGVWRRYGSAVLGSGDAAVDETAGMPLPVPFEAKLVQRAWVPVPPGAVSAGERLVLPADLDAFGAEKALLEIACRVTRGRSLTIVTRNAEPGNPAAAALRGLGRVLAIEHPAQRVRIVDVDTLDALHAEGDTGDDEVAWRDGVRYAARLVRADLAAGPGPGLVRAPLTGTPALSRKRVVRDGAYIVTGGTGRLGGLVERWLLDRGATRVVLNSRSAGTQGDLAAPGTAERLVEAATTGGMPLRGVIHAAGVLDDRLVADLTPESVHRVWTPKVHGALRLHEATKDLDLDWWVAFSSAAGLLGSPGQAAYASANAFLDALCERRRSEGLPGLSIAWGTWQGAAAMPGMEPLTEEEGIEALEALLQRGISAGVVRLDVSRAVAAFPSITRVPYFSGFVQEQRREPGAADLESIVELLRERAATVLGFDPVWLDEGSVLTDLGLDSLAATRLRGMAEHDFGVTVAIAPLLNGGTLGELARSVAAELGVDGGSLPERFVGPRDAAERQVVRVLSGLLGREPGVTEPVPGEILGEALRVLGEELGHVLRVAPRTVAELADAVRLLDEGEAEQGIVRPLNEAARAGTLEGALFLAHPAGGTTGVYALLAGGLDVPVFGLERLEEAGPVEQRAERYARAVRELTGGRAVRLGGWSFGGVLAYEVARRLPETELVVMIDSGLPGEAGPDATASRYARFAAYLSSTYGAAVELTEDDLRGLTEQAQLELLEERVAESGVLAGLGAAILRHQVTSHEDTRALELYEPGPHDGPVVLYRSTEPTPWAVEDPRYAHHDDPTRGFGPHASGLRVVEIGGAHHLNLLDPPHVGAIVKHLKEIL